MLAKLFKPRLRAFYFSDSFKNKELSEENIYFNKEDCKDFYLEKRL